MTNITLASVAYCKATGLNYEQHKTTVDEAMRQALEAFVKQVLPEIEAEIDDKYLGSLPIFSAKEIIRKHLKVGGV